MRASTFLRALRVLPAAVVSLTCLHAHHEAIFGPQSAALIAQRRFVSAQYFLADQGRRPLPLERSHIGVLTAGIGVGARWSLTATLPIESERSTTGETTSGAHDVVLGARYFPEVGNNRTMVAVFTAEPPTSGLEHHAVGLGSGLMYGAERGHWSGIVYGLGRTEFSLDKGEKRGNRLFLGTGLAYEHERLPFSPQLGFSWERVGKRREEGMPVQESRVSALMIHPTVSKTFRQEHVQTFFVVSLPVGQWSGGEGWPRWRIAAGIVWGF